MTSCEHCDHHVISYLSQAFDDGAGECDAGELLLPDGMASQCQFFTPARCPRCGQMMDGDECEAGLCARCLAEVS